MGVAMPLDIQDRLQSHYIAKMYGILPSQVPGLSTYDMICAITGSIADEQDQRRRGL